MTVSEIMSFLFGHARERYKVPPVTPFAVEPANVPNKELEDRAQVGRNALMKNIVLSERRVASIHRSIIHDAVTRVRGG